MKTQNDNFLKEKQVNNSEDLLKPIDKPEDLSKLKEYKPMKTNKNKKSFKRSNLKKKFKCFHCSKSYQESKSRRLHILIVHMMQKYECIKLDCDFIAKRKHLLIKHLKTAHLDLSEEERKELLVKGHDAKPEYMYEDMKQDDSD